VDEANWDQKPTLSLSFRQCFETVVGCGNRKAIRLQKNLCSPIRIPERFFCVWNNWTKYSDKPEKPDKPGSSKKGR